MSLVLHEHSDLVDSNTTDRKVVAESVIRLHDL